MTKFCTSCQATRDLEGGITKHLRGTTRWICKSCVEHKSPSIYRNLSGKPTPSASVKRTFKGIYGQT